MFDTTMAFVDHYETLQLSPAATLEVIERVHRILAKRYHPDNLETGDVERFESVQLAYETLSDPERRAQYDARYEAHRNHEWKIFDQASAGDHREQDRRICFGILTLLYAARRDNPTSGGIGSVTLERMLGCPEEHLQFPLWYLKNRGHIQVEENGQYGITVEGVDKLSKDEARMPTERLLASPAVAGATVNGEFRSVRSRIAS
jgi:curved DNA-binding protein CbpA